MSRLPRGFDDIDGPEIHAILGPTNTGKTHRALERMLRHPTGMIGLPLRLLAREVYDRLTVRVGEGAVALLTGEERRVPKSARYWVCTVEAMPLGAFGEDAVEVDFLAIDEVQLAGDPGRGHVFTDRILHARGRRETVFLGSDTIEPLLVRLVPGIQVDRRPRLSKLSHAGHRKLGSLPKRSAVVAFAGDRVYALAERVRQKHGGAAVVLGALSPRTRNAQVAMFQAGEVSVLVATDAIGMGLNMDVTHVAFAERHKFDGKQIRALYAGELGQIAGRAGRHLADGTFGTTEGCDPLAPDLAGSVEEQRFPPLKRLWWRNGDLDFESVEALRFSLKRPPPRPFLTRADTDEDEAALAVLAEDPEVVRRLVDPAHVSLLWEVCRIPDFRHLVNDAHTGLLSRLFRRLVDHGTLSASWLEGQVVHLDRIDGDIDSLTTRLSYIRTLAYVGHRRGWLDAPGALQAHTREVEERLSDALHQQLTERFVDRRAMALVTGGPGLLDGDRVRVGGVEIGRVEGLTFRGEGGDPTAVPARVRETVAAEIAVRVNRLVEERSDAFVVDDALLVRWRGAAVARIEAGPALGEPTVRLLRNELLAAGARTQVERRMQAWSRDYAAGLLEPLRPPDAPRGAVRGLLFALERGLGTVTADSVADLVQALRGLDRTVLARAEVRLGVEHVYSLPMLTRGRERATLWAAFHGKDRVPALPPFVAGPADPSLPESFYAAIGYRLLGPAAIRVDLSETLGARVRALARSGAFELPTELIEALGEPLARSALEAAGFRAVDGRWVRDAARRPREDARPRRVSV